MATGASLVFIGCPSSDSITMKMLCGVDVIMIPLHQPTLYPFFSIGLVKTESESMTSWDWVREKNMDDTCD